MESKKKTKKKKTHTTAPKHTPHRKKDATLTREFLSEITKVGRQIRKKVKGAL